MAVSHKWQPITDLGDDPNSLTDGELTSLRRVWADQKKELSESGSLEELISDCGVNGQLRQGSLRMYTLWIAVSLKR